MCLFATPALLHPTLYLTADGASSQAGLTLFIKRACYHLVRPGTISANPLVPSHAFELKCSEASGLTWWPI